MTPLTAARTHCLLVEEVERIAPPVSAPYLQAAYDRMRLGVHVEYDPAWTKCFVVWRPWNGTNRIFGERDLAVADYLNVCDMLTPSPSTAPHAVPPLATVTGPLTAEGRSQ